MEYLVTMTTNVPDGTPEEEVNDVRAREDARSRELAAQGYLLRLFRPPLAPGEWRTLGLFAAAGADPLEEVLASMPLRGWRTDDVTPLSPHPNDFAALNKGDPHVLETVWPGDVVIYDPRAGEVRGHRQVRRFVSRNLSWLAGLHANAETVASTVAHGRAVVELLAHLNHGGRELAWPVAVVAESPDDGSVVFRTYCSQWPVDERRHVRAALLEPGPAHPGDVIGRYQAALADGDAEAVVRTFAPDGYFRGPFGPRHTRGTAELRSFFTGCFSAGGGIGLEHCAVTDDGVRCALEYNCVRWGSHDLPPQAGIGVYERGPDGLLAAARVYDDIEPPPEVAGQQQWSPGFA